MNAEATLLAVALAIYLVDCVVLLERGQALWSRGGMTFGSIHYQLRGRVVALLNPFTPFLASFRTRPLFAMSAGVPSGEASAALAPLRVPALLQLLLVLAALPYCLLQAPGWPFFAALLLAYLNAIALLALIAWRFRRARIAARPLVALGFGWLVCLPLSINAVRKAALTFDLGLDAREAIGLLPEPSRERARGELAAQAAEAIQELDEGGERHRRLTELERELRGLLSPERS